MFNRAINVVAGRRSVVSIAAAVTLLAGGAGIARGQQPTRRERELEDLVRKLNERVESLERRLEILECRNGPARAPKHDNAEPPRPSNAASSETAKPDTADRLDELEQAVRDIRTSKPPDLDAEQVKKIEKWVNDPLTMRPFWKDGLRFETSDKSFQFKIGGRLHWDAAYFAERGLGRRFGEIDDNHEMRRARIALGGEVYETIFFKTQYDFAEGVTDFKDVYVGASDVPWLGNIQFGQFKEPFSLEEQSSSNDLPLIERSVLNAFNPGRNTGVMAFDTFAGERASWAISLFRQTDNFGNGLVGGRDYNVGARVTALPIFEHEGKRYLHVGVSFSRQHFEDDTFRISARPEAHLAPRLVDTGDIAVEDGGLLGFELAWVDGPFSVQSEYAYYRLEGADDRTGNPDFWAAYVLASLFVTGEHRPYNTNAGTFTRVRPMSNFDGKGGPGAWEVAARYSYLTLNDRNIKGGRIDNISLGVNWYWNPNMRMMWNYVFADPSEGGELNVFQWRVQFAF